MLTGFVTECLLLRCLPEVEVFFHGLLISGMTKLPLTFIYCSVSVSGYVWQEDGREEDEQEWTLSQATRQAKLQLDL